MSETPLDLALIEARADQATPGPWKVWAMSVLADPVGNSNLDDGIRIANTFFTINGHPRTNDADFIAAARTDVPALLAEVDRLARVVNGYARTPVEQRAADAEAEVDSLRASNGQIRGDLERLRAENAGLRVCGNLACKVINYAADRCPACGFPNKLVLFAPDEPADHDPADCPVCRAALGLPEPVDAAGEARTGPVAAHGWPLGQLTISEADDAGQGRDIPEALLAIKPDVSGFEAQS